MTDLDEIERLLAKATKGPWIRHNNPKKWVSTLSPVSDEEWRANCDNDAELVIALRNAAPAMIAELKALREVVKHYAHTFCEGFGECVGDLCGKLPGDECAGCPAHAALLTNRAAAMNELIASTADEYGVQNDGTD